MSLFERFLEAVFKICGATGVRRLLVLVVLKRANYSIKREVRTSV